MGGARRKPEADACLSHPVLPTHDIRSGTRPTTTTSTYGVGEKKLRQVKEEKKKDAFDGTFGSDFTQLRFPDIDNSTIATTSHEHALERTPRTWPCPLSDLYDADESKGFKKVSRRKET